MFALYQFHEKEVDGLLDRATLKQQILSHFPSPVILYAPPGSGAFSFAKTCLAAAGFHRPTVMDALDAASGSYGNIRQSLYTRSDRISYIFKNGHGHGLDFPRHIPSIGITHHPIPPHERPSDILYISLSPLSELQFTKLFYLYTCDPSVSLSAMYHSAGGSFHGLAHVVLLYRTNIRAFYSFMNEFHASDPIHVPKSESEVCPWNIPTYMMSEIRELYGCRRDMPSMEDMWKTWPQYISSAWRIVLPRYAAFVKCGILSDICPTELVCWYMMHQFRGMPAKGKSDLRSLPPISQELKLESMHDTVLYSAYSYALPREAIDCMFRRIHNAYYARLRSNKNKITGKTKKESIDGARMDLFRETGDWNDKLFRRWAQYTAAFSR